MLSSSLIACVEDSASVCQIYCVHFSTWPQDVIRLGLHVLCSRQVCLKLRSTSQNSANKSQDIKLRKCLNSYHT